jgi:abortive infection bacteriophage resistance protein
MKYTKLALSFEQQAQRLIDRGLIVEDKSKLVQCLSRINYYRLSAYWYPFKRSDPKTGKEIFAPGTTFNTIWRRYMFDRDLRLLVMDAIEQIEVTILRTRMVEQFTLLHGPFCYCVRSNFNPLFPEEDYKRLLSDIDNAVNRSKEEFVARYRSKYIDEPRLPLWMAAETMTFGQLYTMFRYLHRDEQKKLAKQFDLFPPVLESWLHTLNFIRNACAHHARLWNREIPIRPRLPEKRHHPEWYSPISLSNNRIFAVLTLMRYLLTYIDPQNDWQVRLERLISNYPEILVRLMGFPEKWLDFPIWKR